MGQSRLFGGARWGYCCDLYETLAMTIFAAYYNEIRHSVVLLPSLIALYNLMYSAAVGVHMCCTMDSM